MDCYAGHVSWANDSEADDERALGSRQCAQQCALRCGTMAHMAHQIFPALSHATSARTLQLPAQHIAPIVGSPRDCGGASAAVTSAHMVETTSALGGAPAQPGPAARRMRVFRQVERDPPCTRRKLPTRAAERLLNKGRTVRACGGEAAYQAGATVAAGRQAGRGAPRGEVRTRGSSPSDILRGSYTRRWVDCTRSCREFCAPRAVCSRRHGRKIPKAAKLLLGPFSDRKLKVPHTHDERPIVSRNRSKMLKCARSA